MKFGTVLQSVFMKYGILVTKLLQTFPEPMQVTFGRHGRLKQPGVAEKYRRHRVSNSLSSRQMFDVGVCCRSCQPFLRRYSSYPCSG